MAVAVVNSASNDSAGSATNSFSFDATGADALVLFVSASATPTVTAASTTYNGIAFTEFWDTGDVGALMGAGLMLLAPASGSHTLTVTFSAAADSSVIVVALSGVEQSSVANAHRTVAFGTGGGGGSPSQTATSVVGDFVIAGVSTSSATVAAGQTPIAEVEDYFGGSISLAAEFTTAAGVSTTMTFTSTVGGVVWIEGAFAVIAAAGGAPPLTLVLEEPSVTVTTF